MHSLKKGLFNIDAFREKQEEIINATLSNRDCFVIMPTGRPWLQSCLWQ